VFVALAIKLLQDAHDRIVLSGGIPTSTPAKHKGSSLHVLGWIVPVPRIMRAVWYKDMCFIKRDLRLFLQIAILFIMMLVFSLVGISQHRVVEEVLLSWMGLMFFASILAATLGSIAIPMEGLSFNYLKLSPQPIRLYLNSKRIAIVLLVFTLGTLNIIVSMILQDISVHLFLSALIVLGLFCYGSTTIGLFLGSYFGDFKWEQHERIISYFGTLMTLVSLFIYFITSTTLLYIGWRYELVLPALFVFLIFTILIGLALTVMTNRRLEKLEWVFD
jgi:hypothetical protein